MYYELTLFSVALLTKTVSTERINLTIKIQTCFHYIINIVIVIITTFNFNTTEDFLTSFLNFTIDFYYLVVKCIFII